MMHDSAVTNNHAAIIPDQQIIFKLQERWCRGGSPMDDGVRQSKVAPPAIYPFSNSNRARWVCRHSIVFSRDLFRS
ncbi:unnamed protein product [Urochloa humidicola]